MYMGGALIETEARRILNSGRNEGRNEGKREVIEGLVKMGKLTIEEIAECANLSVAEVKQLVESWMTQGK